MSVTAWLTAAGFGEALTPMAMVPLPTATCVVACAPAGYWLSPDHLAVIDQVPAVVGVHEIVQDPFVGVQLCCVKVEPLGPVPVKVIRPSLAGTDSVAVRTVA